MSRILLQALVALPDAPGSPSVSKTEWGVGGAPNLNRNACAKDCNYECCLISLQVFLSAPDNLGLQG